MLKFEPDKTIYETNVEPYLKGLTGLSMQTGTSTRTGDGGQYPALRIAIGGAHDFGGDEAFEILDKYEAKRLAQRILEWADGGE